MKQSVKWLLTAIASVYMKRCLFAGLIALSLSLEASWVYTETNTVDNGVSKGFITDGKWTFYAQREKGSVLDIKINATNGISFDSDEPAEIDFSEIEGGYRITEFNAGRSDSPLRHFATKVIAPHCVKMDGSDGFKNNLNLTTVELSSDPLPQLVGDRLFYYCSNLREFSPRRIAGTSVRTGLFQGCSSLAGKLEFPSSTQFVGKDNFNGCSSLQEVEAPNVKVLPQACFSGCASLTNVILSSSIDQIGVNAFYGTAIPTEVAQRILANSVTLLGKYQTSKDFYQGGCFSLCTGLSGKLVWQMPNLITNVVPSACFSGAVLGKMVFKTPIDTFEGEAFFNTCGADGAATELYLHKQVPALVSKKAFMRISAPYTKVYVSGNIDGWLDAIEKNADHNFIRKEDFQNREWAGSKHTSINGWDGITNVMAKDATMCKKEGSGNAAVFTVLDKRVIAFAFVYGSSGGGCWILDPRTDGMQLKVR